MTKAERILETWDANDTEDISTEMLFAIVEDITGYDAGDIAEALYKERTKK